MLVCYKAILFYPCMCVSVANRVVGDVTAEHVTCSLHRSRLRVPRADVLLHAFSSRMYKGVRLAPDALKLRVAQLCIGSEARETAIASMLISSPAHHRLLAISNTVGYLLATDNPDGVWSA
jgi:hypothetical protein